MELCERLLERGVFAQGIRPPTVPEGSSRLRFTVMATHARGRAAATRRGWSARRRASWASPRRGRPARSPRRRLSAVVDGRLRHRHRHRGRQDRGRRGRSPARSPPPASAVAVFKPAVTGLDDAAARPDHELLRRAAGLRRRATRRSPPTATGRRPRRTWRRSWPASEIEPGAAARRGARAAAAGADALVCEGVGGLLVPLAAGLPGPRPRGRPRAAAGRSPPRPASARSTTRC